MINNFKKVIGLLLMGKEGMRELYRICVWYYDFNRVCERRIIKASRLYHKGGFWRLISLFIHKRNRKRFPCEIYPHVKIEGRLIIPHCVGIVVGKTAELGDGTKIMPNVVIGAKYSCKQNILGKKRRHARIGRNCFIGANAVILGDIEIGDNVLIGAGSIVTCNVPADSVVVGFNKITSKNS